MTEREFLRLTLSRLFKVNRAHFTFRANTQLSHNSSDSSVLFSLIERSGMKEAREIDNILIRYTSLLEIHEPEI